MYIRVYYTCARQWYMLMKTPPLKQPRTQAPISGRRTLPGRWFKLVITYNSI